MIVLIILAKVLLMILYFIFKFLPSKNRIVFISRQSNSLSLDFCMLKNGLENKCDYEIVVITSRMEKSFKEIIKNINVIIKEAYYLATSKICITDGYNIPISVLKHKKDLKIFQIWHSLGAIKKFGYQSLDTNKKNKIAKILKMHKNYDYIICGSDAMKNYFAQAFNYDVGYLYSLGLPRIDYIKDSYDINRNNIYNTYGEFKDKKVILYVPTFRDNNNYKINELVDAIDLNKYILILKIHPNMKCNVKMKKNVYTCPDFTSIDLMSVADYIITDYSAISIEASILDKPIFLYCYDYEEYSKYPGLNIDLKKELPKYLFYDAKELYRTLSTKKYNINVVKKYKNKYVIDKKDGVTSSLVDFIIERGITNEKTD